MSFGYHTLVSMGLAVDLANTLRPVKGEDALEDEGDLERFLADHEEALALAAGESGEDPMGISEERLGVGGAYREVIKGWRVGAGEVEAVRTLRGTLRAVFEVAASDEKKAASLLNEGLRLSGATPRVRRHRGSLHLHFESVEGGCAGWLAATTLMGLVDVLCDQEGNRLGMCASPSCRSTFVDLSKNASKLYCSQGCAHRASVAAYRARRRAGS